MRVVRAFVVLSLAAVTLAGCMGGDEAAITADEPLLLAVGEDGASYVPNQWLLGGPGPVYWTRVSSGSEPSIYSSADGSYLYVGDTSGGYRSNDGGVTWSRMGNPFFITADGWDFAIDDDGTIYAITTSIPYVDVARSVNHGGSWTVSRLVGAAPVADRPWIASNGDGVVAVVFWAYPTAEQCHISYDRSTTWTDRSPSAGSPNAGNIVFDTDSFYYASEGGRVSRVQLNDLGLPVACTNGYSTRTYAVGNPGINGFVPVGVDDGQVFIAYPSGNNDEMILAGSEDWSSTVKRITVSGPALKSNTFPALDVQDGRAVVAWYGSETDGNFNSASFNGAWNVFVAVVDDFFTDTPSVSYYRLTDEPNHIGDICVNGIGCSGSQDRDLLDYFGVEQDPSGGIHVAYVHDGDTSNANVRYARLTE